MGVVWQSGRGHPKFFSALRAPTLSKEPPFFFLIVMDEMLRVMTTMNSGVSIAGLYLGTAAHADPYRRQSQQQKTKPLLWLNSPSIKD